MKKQLLAVLLVIAAVGGLQAGQTVVASPDKTQVKAFSDITHPMLRWSGNALTATITFSNVNYVSSIEARDDEERTFVLPGVKYDSASGVFSRNGIPVATMKQGLFGKQINLAPGARIMALDSHGMISLMLVASNEPITGDHWVRVEETPELHRMFANARGYARGHGDRG